MNAPRAGRWTPEEVLRLAWHECHPHPYSRRINRHDVRRKARQLVPFLRVASDALEQQDRTAAIEVLVEVLPLECAVRLTEVPRWEAVADTRHREHYDAEQHPVRTSHLALVDEPPVPDMRLDTGRTSYGIESTRLPRDARIPADHCPFIWSDGHVDTARVADDRPDIWLRMPRGLDLDDGPQRYQPIMGVSFRRVDELVGDRVVTTYRQE